MNMNEPKHIEPTYTLLILKFSRGGVFNVADKVVTALGRP